MSMGFYRNDLQDVAYVTRNVNGEDITWLVKFHFMIDNESPMDEEAAVWVQIRELGTNKSLSHTTVGDWSATIYDRTRDVTKGIWIDSSIEYDGFDLIEIFNEDATKDTFVPLTPTTAYEPINNEFQTVAYERITYDFDFTQWSLYGEYSLFEIQVNCPANSIFDGYGKYSTNFLDGAYMVSKSVSGSYVKSYIKDRDFGFSIGSSDTTCSFGSSITPSEIVAANGNIGDDIDVHIESDSSLGSIPVLHKVYYSYDNSTWTEIPLSHYSVRDFTWTIPMEYYAQIPNDRWGDIYFKVETMGFDEDGNDTVVATETTTITAYTVEAECIPDLSPTIYDSNSVTVALTGNNQHLVRHKSHATYDANATVKHYATIASIEVANGSQSFNTETGTFYGFVNDYFTFEVIDSRGYSKKISITPTIVPYVLLTCIADAEAPTAEGDLNFTVFGNYFNGSFGAKSNTLQVFYRIKEISQTTGEGSFSAWKEVPFELGTNKYTAVVSIKNLDYRNTFIIEAYAVDVFGTIYSDEEATSALPIFDWGINDFNMNCDMTVYGTLTVNGNVVATGSVNGQGTNVSSYEIHYGTCQSAGDISAKLVTCPTFTNLATGSSIRVKFAYANTAANVVMNVNNTGVVSVKKNDTDRDLTGAWKKGAVRDFVYDGTNWIMVSYD